MAHEDIRPTQEWQETILKKLDECDAFLTLLTRHFQISNWTDQETGVALCLHKRVIPIKIDVNPYGFISKYQAFRWNRDDKEDSIERLVRVLFEKHVISTAALIEAFEKSISFSDAALKSELLREIGRLSARQINQIVKAASENNQIYGSFKTQDSLRKLFSKYSHVVEPRILEKAKQRYAI